MVSPSFAIRDPRGRAPFPSRSRLCRSARGARVDILRLVRGNSDNFKTERGSMGTNPRFTTRQKHRERSPMGKQYGQSPESPRAEAGKARVPFGGLIFGGHSSAREGRSPPRTRAEGPVRQGRTPTPRTLRGGFDKTADVPSGGTTARGEDLERVKKQHGRHRRQPQLPRGGSHAHVRDRRYVHADELDRAERSSPGQPRPIATRKRGPVPSRS